MSEKKKLCVAGWPVACSGVNQGGTPFRHRETTVVSCRRNLTSRAVWASVEQISKAKESKGEVGNHSVLGKGNNVPCCARDPPLASNSDAEGFINSFRTW